jgi:hypothetical protein
VKYTADRPRLTRKTVNKAIAHLGLEIQDNGDGYFYFTDTTTGDVVGDSVFACRLNFNSLPVWIMEAEDARGTQP